MAKIKGLYVALEFDVNEDSIEYIINAIKMLKLVVDVRPIEANPDDFLNRAQIKYEFRERVINLLTELWNQ